MRINLATIYVLIINVIYQTYKIIALETEEKFYNLFQTAIC